MLPHDGRGRAGEEPELGKQVFAWVQKAIAAARQPVLDARVGDSLKALGLEKEALDYWKSGLTLNREESVRLRLRRPRCGG